MSERRQFGIDVSEWQGVIDWQAVAESGVEFAMIRATHGRTGDAYFTQNMEGALAAGLSVGVYCCSYATTVGGVLAEAAYFLETISPYREEITFPAAIDAEQEMQYRLGKSAVTDLLTAFCEAVTEAGYLPMVYTNCNWLNHVIDKAALADAGIDIWVSWPKKVTSFADLPQDEVTKHDHTMWQFSCDGRVSGIAGRVDLNVSYVDYAQEAPVLSAGFYLSWDEAREILADTGCEGILL